MVYCRPLLAALLLMGSAVAAQAAPKGAEMFDANCAFCHQAGGVGVPGQYPRLESRAGAIAAKPEGRQYLTEVVLTGLSGKVSVDGQDIIGLMPSFASLSDGELAAVLTYVSHLGKAKPAPFTPKELAAARARPALSPGDLVAERGRLVADKIVP